MAVAGMVVAGTVGFAVAGSAAVESAAVAFAVAFGEAVAVAIVAVEAAVDPGSARKDCLCFVEPGAHILRNRLPCLLERWLSSVETIVAEFDWFG